VVKSENINSDERLSDAIEEIRLQVERHREIRLQVERHQRSERIRLERIERTLTSFKNYALISMVTLLAILIIVFCRQ
jgi:hypothetical protein